MKTPIGKVLVLFRSERKEKAYVDQFDIPHAGSVLLEQVRVRIVATSSPRGYWDDKKIYKKAGLKARSRKGEVFTCNWKSYDENCMTPTFYWDGPDRPQKHLRFEDAIQTLNFAQVTQVPFVTPDGKAITLPRGIRKCKKHHRYYSKDCPCSKCLSKCLLEGLSLSP